MQQITVHVPDEKVGEFYVRFGEFLGSTEPAAGLATATVTPIGEAASLSGGGWTGVASEMSLLRFWRGLSRPAKEAIQLVLEAALETPARGLRPQELADELGQVNGVSGIAGIFGGAGRAADKARVPRDTETTSEPWHHLWEWDGYQYSMRPDVARALLAQIKNNATLMGSQGSHVRPLKW